MWRWAAGMIIAVGCGRAHFDPMPDASPACAPTKLLDDDFTGVMVDSTTWNVQTNPSFTVGTDAALLVTFAPSVPPLTGAGVLQQASFSVRGACVTSRMTMIPVEQTSAYCNVGWITPTNDQVGWSFGSGLVRANYFEAASSITTTVSSYTFDTGVFVRFREDTGTYFWEVSDDDATFQPFASAPIPTTTFDPSSAKVQLLCSSVNALTTNAGGGTFAFVREEAP
jgi:hypothetical protein